MRTRNIVILVISGFFAVVIAFGAYVIFTSEGQMLYLATFKPDDPLLTPDSAYLEVVEKRKEVEQFNETYPNVERGSVFRSGINEEPYFVTYGSRKIPRIDPIGEQANASRADRAILQIGINQTTLIVQDVAFYCYYEDDAYAIDRFIIRGDEVLHYLEKMGIEVCWDDAPPISVLMLD